MLEDDIYRTSSQYRLWSFTKDSLQAIRTNTNSLASERVRAAIHRAQDARQPGSASGAGGDGAAVRPSGDSTPNPEEAGREKKVKDDEGKDIECLTPEEELELVQYYCEKTLDLGDEYKPSLPSMVRATAIQYLRRFYLYNSPMSYHPKSIMPCALFLATKTDNYYMSLSSFSEKIPNTSTEDVIAPEFLLTQGLRFTFDVRHPFRGLEGGVMELTAISQGESLPGPHHPEQKASELQRTLQSLPPAPSADSSSKPVSLGNRIAKAHHETREILKTAAQMTDAYFLYTPPQIWLAAFLLADRPLAEFYLDAKLGTTSATDTTEDASAEKQQALSALRMKLTGVLSSCCDLLSSYLSTQSNAGPARLKSLKRIDKKLYHCQNPEKADLVGLNRAQKREGNDAAATAGAATGGTSAAPTPTGEDTSQPPEGKSADEDTELQRVAKKRKLERERFQKEGAEVFGGELIAEKERGDLHDGESS